MQHFIFCCLPPQQGSHRHQRDVWPLFLGSPVPDAEEAYGVAFLSDLLQINPLPRLEDPSPAAGFLAQSLPDSMPILSAPRFEVSSPGALRSALQLRFCSSLA